MKRNLVSRTKRRHGTLENQLGIHSSPHDPQGKLSMQIRDNLVQRDFAKDFDQNFQDRSEQLTLKSREALKRTALSQLLKLLGFAQNGFGSAGRVFEVFPKFTRSRVVLKKLRLLRETKSRGVKISKKHFLLA